MATRYHKFYVYKPTPTAIPDWTSETAANILASFVNQLCVVDADFEGTWDEEDSTDSCSDGINETILTTLDPTISATAFKKRDINDALPTALLDVRTAFTAKEPIYVLMLDGAKDNVGSDGVWLLANVKQFKQGHKTKGGNTLDLQFRSAGQVTGLKKFSFIQVPAPPP